MSVTFHRFFIYLRNSYPIVMKLGVPGWDYMEAPVIFSLYPYGGLCFHDTGSSDYLFLCYYLQPCLVMYITDIQYLLHE